MTGRGGVGMGGATGLASGTGAYGATPGGVMGR